MSGNVDPLVMRYRLEDAEEQEFQKRVTKIAARLHVGMNYVPPADFQDLVYFYIEDQDERSDTFKRGSFWIMKRVEVILERRPGAFKTLAAIARDLNVQDDTLRRWVRVLSPPFRMSGTKKVYDIEQIRELILSRNSSPRTGLR